MAFVIQSKLKEELESKEREEKKGRNPEAVSFPYSSLHLQPA